jgi:tRNA dimethylallyltransferase
MAKPVSSAGDICAEMNALWVDQMLPRVSRQRPVLIAGPTASGKSALALALARRDERIVINADAMQVYARWRVLTARPSSQEEAQAEHQLYGHVGDDVPYSVGHWLREVAALLELGRGVVIVGGTGLYFSALTEGLVEIPATPPLVRATADARRAELGIGAMLAELDAKTAARIDRSNPARVQRAWEVLQATGRGLADWQEETGPALLSLTKAEAIVLQPEASWLNARIDQRFDSMMGDGALDEAAAALPDWDPTLPSARAIGAAELIAYLRAQTDLPAAIEAAKLASRQYAKRQRTWLRSRMRGWHGVLLP